MDEPTAMSITGTSEFEDQYREILKVRAYDSSDLETIFKGLAIPHDYATQNSNVTTDPMEENRTKYLPEQQKFEAERASGRNCALMDLLGYETNSIQDLQAEYANKARMEFAVYEHRKTGKRSVQVTSYSQDLLNGGQLTPHVVTKPQAIKILSNPDNYDIYLRKKIVNTH